MKLNSRNQVNKHGLCLGCGLCSLADDVKMNLNSRQFVPSSISKNKMIEQSCPAKGYDIKGLGLYIFGNVNYRYEIGFYRKLRLACSNNSDILKRASSGGVMTQIALYLLSTNKIDAVITNRFIYNGNMVRTETYIASNLDELLQGQGSKYCPTSTLSILSLLDKTKRYLLIGTPCQIAGFRMYAKGNTYYQKMIPYTIANFCGGYRDFRELDFFVKKLAHVRNVVLFRHRGGGQPGSMLIEGGEGEVFKYPYPDYAKISYVVKNERCTLCVDATGELADFSCGDAWLKNRDTSKPWSIIVARSKNAEVILEEMEKSKKLIFKGDISEEDLIYSQKSNITSKKYRQYNRIKLRDLLLMYSPDWRGNFPIKHGSLLGEFKIFIAKMKTSLINRFRV